MEYQDYKRHQGFQKKKAGYEYLLAWKITVPIYDYTVVFCRRYRQLLSSYRTYDQMVQSARSGMTNLPEGNLQKSSEGYLKLTGVNRASLEELLKDFLSFARQNKIPIWPPEKAKGEIKQLDQIWRIIKNNPTLPDNPDFPNLPDNLEITVNLMITLISQANYLQDRLRQGVEKKFIKEGGFRENLLKKRLAYRSKGGSA